MAYLLFLSRLLIAYYQKDYVRTTLTVLRQQQVEIRASMLEKLAKKEQKAIDNFFIFLYAQVKKNTQEYATSCARITEIRKCIEKLNIRRAQFNTSRTLAAYLITYLQKSTFCQITQGINEFLGTQFNDNDGLKLLNASKAVLAPVGIVLTALRLLINLALLCKHVIHAASDKDLSVHKVICHEMEKRALSIEGDLVGVTVSLITTYNKYFHLANSALAPIIACSLTLDILIFSVLWFLERKKYKRQRDELMEQKKEASAEELFLIERQLDLLQDEWIVTCSYFKISYMAATLLLVSFVGSILCPASMVLVGTAILGMLGNALYNTTQEFKKYHQGKVAVERELANGLILNDAHHQELLNTLQQESEQNYIQFCKKLTFNFGGAAFIITAVVFSWPVALCLMLGYISYQLNQTYQKQLNQSHKAEPAHDIYRLFHTKTKAEPLYNMTAIPVLK